MLYDPVRLLVATSVPHTACHTPHLIADVLVALKTHVDTDTVLVKASTYDKKLSATFTVRGKTFQMTQCDDHPWFSVASGARVVRVNPLRETDVDAPRLIEALDAYAKETPLSPGREYGVTRVSYFEPSSFVDAVQLVLITS